VIMCYVQSLPHFFIHIILTVMSSPLHEKKAKPDKYNKDTKDTGRLFWKLYTYLLFYLCMYLFRLGTTYHANFVWRNMMTCTNLKCFFPLIHFTQKKIQMGWKYFQFSLEKNICGKINKSGYISILLDLKVFRRVFLYP